MIALNRKDWAEIYYAVDAKLKAVRQSSYGSEFQPGEDAKWIAHLQAIKRKLGPDGLRAATEGVENS